MPNRAQRRKNAREARAGQAIMNLPKVQRELEGAKAKEAAIERFIQENSEHMNQGGLSTLRREADAQFKRRMDAHNMVVNALEQNGITLKDLENEYKRGREEGFQQAGMEIIQCCYAGICIALHDTFKFGEERCYRALKACDEKIIFVLNHSEMAGELLAKTGLTIDWDDPFERVQKIEK